MTSLTVSITDELRVLLLPAAQAMAAAAVARRARLGMGAEVASTTTYLLVRCAAAHPPSWHTRHGRAWIAPFAYGAQQATAAATTAVAAAAAAATAAATATGNHSHRPTLSPTPHVDDLFSFAHISIVLLSFFPLVIYLALQRNSMSSIHNAGCSTLSDGCRGGERMAIEGQAMREKRLAWSKLGSVDAASSSFGAVASTNVFYPAGTGLRYGRAASKRGKPGEEAEEQGEEPEPCSAWEISCRLETLLAWWWSAGVGSETRVKAALRREVPPAGNRRWRTAESMGRYTRALVQGVSANEAAGLRKDGSEGGHHGVWDLCMRMTATSPETIGQQGGTQEGEDEAADGGELPRG